MNAPPPPGSGRYAAPDVSAPPPLGRYAAPDVSERLLTKMYSEAMRSLPAGQYLISAEVFVTVACAFGLDR